MTTEASGGDEEFLRVLPPSASEKRSKNWCRKEVALWLIEQAKEHTFIVGIDHGFSMPITYFKRYGLKTWDAFLDDFCEHWPTDQENTYVDSIRNSDECPPARTGSNDEFRLTEKWTSSAKSVFHFDIQGQVAKSTRWPSLASSNASSSWRTDTFLALPRLVNS
jgi:hypothetical protein